MRGRGGRPGLPIPNSPQGLRGRKATSAEGGEGEKTQCFVAGFRSTARQLMHQNRLSKPRPATESSAIVTRDSWSVACSEVYSEL